MLFHTALFLITAAGLYAGETDDVFTAVGVQFEITADKYVSREHFFGSVYQAVEDALDREYRPDLIIFPEYIGVYYQLIEFNDIINEHEQFQPAAIDLLQEYQEYNSVAELFIGPEAWKSYIDGWSRIAQEFEVSLIAGSCFFSDDAATLKNRAFVFDSSGELIYHQDKVFLTDFETDIVGLSPGSLDDAGFFQCGRPAGCADYLPRCIFAGMGA